LSAAPDDPELVELASAISSGVPVEWQDVLNKISAGGNAEVFDDLRLIEAIAQFHRDSTTPSPPVVSGDRWGHFVLLEPIGTGSFATVYRARDTKLDCEVAVKLLRPPSGVVLDEAKVLAEARRLARVRHPNVVSVYGADYIDGQVGIWMEFVKGRTLADALKAQGSFGAPETALIGLDVCRALAAVHRAGLLHGDLKAQNVMREQGGRTVLMDFGTGKDLVATNDTTTVITVNDFAGTPLYLPPEVFAGASRSKAVDIYSLGVLLYHLLTGGFPVDGKTSDDVREAHARGDRHHLRDVRPDLSDAFVAIVEHALAIDPLRRFGTIGAFEQELARFIGTPSQLVDDTPRRDWSRRSPLVVASAVAGVVLATLLVVWTVNRTSAPSTPNVRALTPSAVQPDAAAVAPAASADGEYTIDASLYRAAGNTEVPLPAGGRVAPGDRLALHMRTSRPTYVYVVDEDDQGESYLLFPLPNQQPANPLPAGTSVRLPGGSSKQPVYWQVTSAGGREHFLIFVTPEPLGTFDRMFASLARPVLNAPVLSARMPTEAVGILRGIGGITAATAVPGRGLLADQFTTPLRSGTEVARGLWVRQITLENPGQ
jgi:eukaryotic-like serine/threonine-protein kinase